MVRGSSVAEELQEMGFAPTAVSDALHRCRGDKEAALHILLGTSMAGEVDPQAWSRGKAAGLIHIGATAYVNSLLQTYFAIPTLAKTILSFRPVEPDSTRVTVILIKRLQELFARLALTERKAIDPSPVLTALRDDAGTVYTGKQVYIGDETDVGEFSMWLVSRIEDGLKSERSFGKGAFLDFDTLRHKDSFRCLSESEMINEGIISNLFFGTLADEIHYTEADGSAAVISKKTLFAHFLVNADQGELVGAWKRAMAATIPEYRTPAGLVTSCVQESWVRKLPKALVFQIARGRHVKPFRFPTVLYPDQFLESNKALISDIHDQSASLQKRISQLERKLEKMENFKKSNQSAQKVLQLADSFVTDQRTNSDYTVIEEEHVQVYSPLSLFPVTDEIKEKLSATSGLFDAFISSMQTTQKSTADEIKELKAQLDRLYTRPELTKHCYRLHSVLQRSGTSQFNAYIYSPDSQLWRKFSDERVAELSELKVMQETQCDSQYSVTYGLVYLHESIAQGWQTESFSAIVPSALFRLIEADNRKLKGEFDENLVAVSAQRISALYFDRQAKAVAQATNSGGKAVDLINFPVFMKSKGDEMLSRWVLLDQCTREIEHCGLYDILREPLGVKLHSIKQSGPWPITLKLSGTEEKKVKALLKEYEEGYRDALLVDFVLRAMNEVKFEEAFFGLTAVLNRGAGRSKYWTVAHDLAEILALRLTSEIARLMFNVQFEEALKILGLTCTLISVCMDPRLLVVKQVLYNLDSSYKWLEGPGREVSSAEFRQEFRSLVTKVKKGDVITTVELSASIHALEEVKQAAAHFSGNQWSEGWLSNKLATRYTVEYQRLRVTTYEVWVEMHSYLKRNDQLMPDSMREKFEVRAKMRPELT